MKAIHAILSAAKAVLAAAGLKRYAVAAEVADVALTGVEAIIAQVKTHAADGASTVFLEAPADLSVHMYKQYVETLRAAFERDREASTVSLPRVVFMPPGMTMAVVRETAAEFEHVIEHLKSINQPLFKVQRPFAPDTKEA